MTLMVIANTIVTITVVGCFIAWLIFPERLPLTQGIPLFISLFAALWIMWKAAFSIRSIEQKYLN